jgi:hypothetical protein
MSRPSTRVVAWAPALLSLCLAGTPAFAAGPSEELDGSAIEPDDAEQPSPARDLRELFSEDRPLRYGPYAEPSQARPTRDAREGFLFSVGLGGAQNYLSGVGHASGPAVDLRLGYGFSDRFQLFFDLNALPARYGRGYDATSWTGTLRGQTVLIGDRRGNGLNLNLGAGLGGMDVGSGYEFVSQRVGFAVAGGLSLDLRVQPWFAISPEFTAQWHQIPNDPGFPSDIHRAFGFLLNFVWYSPY